LHGVEEGLLHVERVGMLDGAPLLDIKPYIGQHSARPRGLAREAVTVPCFTA
jgi:tRNA (Thr-GGU) A37 N-methylase